MPEFVGGIRRGAFLEIKPNGSLGKICHIQYIPSTWDDQIGVNTQNQNIPGTEAPTQQYVFTKERILKLKLLYNSYTNDEKNHPIGQGGSVNTSIVHDTQKDKRKSGVQVSTIGNTVEAVIKFFMENCEPQSSFSNRVNFGTAPNILRFIWGNSKAFGTSSQIGQDAGPGAIAGSSANYMDCILVNVKVKRGMFKSPGEKTDVATKNIRDAARKLPNSNHPRLPIQFESRPSISSILETRRAFIELELRKFREFPF